MQLGYYTANIEACSIESDLNTWYLASFPGSHSQIIRSPEVWAWERGYLVLRTDSGLTRRWVMMRLLLECLKLREVSVVICCSGSGPCSSPTAGVRGAR